MLSYEERYEYETPELMAEYSWGTQLGWEKYQGNPIIGGKYGTCFDISVLKENGKFRMWLSWRSKKSIGYCESEDGIHWTAPKVVLAPLEGSDWEGDELNRPSVLKVGEKYRMWYSGQMLPYVEGGTSDIGYAESDDGIHWIRPFSKPVLSPSAKWEKKSLMCPHVNYNEKRKIYEMWYSGGGQHEPDAIGYASSPDGVHWEKFSDQPVFICDPANRWEQHKAAACQVIQTEDYYYMLYIGYHHEERGSIGIARSKDGKTNWERHPKNPIIAPDKNSWDAKSVYKPFALWDADHWILWYNGADYNPDYFDFVLEQIGVAFLYRKDLWPTE